MLYLRIANEKTLYIDYYIDFKAAEAVVDATHRYKEIFYGDE